MDINSLVEKEIRQTQSIVEDVLRDEPATRNSDKLLTFRVMQKVLHQAGSNLLRMDISDLGKIPAFETVKRIRAKIQNDEGRYLPTDEAARKRRRIKEDIFRRYAVGATPTFEF